MSKSVSKFFANECVGDSFTEVKHDILTILEYLRFTFIKDRVILDYTKPAHCSQTETRV